MGGDVGCHPGRDQGQPGGREAEEGAWPAMSLTPSLCLVVRARVAAAGTLRKPHAYELKSAQTLLYDSWWWWWWVQEKNRRAKEAKKRKKERRRQQGQGEGEDRGEGGWPGWPGSPSPIGVLVHHYAQVAMKHLMLCLHRPDGCGRCVSW
jgi:hypothetical protein